MSASQPLTQNEQLLEKIATLQEQLEKKLPGYKDTLQAIHSNLRQNEDLVHILKPEDIGVIVAGLSKHKNVVIAASLAKAKTPKEGKKQVSLEDI